VKKFEIGIFNTSARPLTIAPSMPTSILTQRVVHWDVDGVLVNSEKLHREKLQVVAELYGVRLDEEHFNNKQRFNEPDQNGEMVERYQELHGVGDKSIYYWLLSQKPALSVCLSKQTWLDKLLAYYLSKTSEIVLFAYAASLIQKFHTDGVIQGVVTSGIPKQVEANISQLRDAKNCLAYVLNASDVQRSKPDPQGYLISVDRAHQIAIGRNVDPENIFDVAVEDSPSGVDAALAAGIYCVQKLLPGELPRQVDTKYQDKFTFTYDEDIEAKIIELHEKAEAKAQERHIERSKIKHHGP
jgi:beta-phosphoglucomutase-like phosphatase (HAD superfamily)